MSAWERRTDTTLVQFDPEHVVNLYEIAAVEKPLAGSGAITEITLRSGVKVFVDGNVDQTMQKIRTALNSPY